jgi:mannose-6-phosphate isomerase-like protein (cupin superfamily)
LGALPWFSFKVWIQEVGMANRREMMAVLGSAMFALGGARASAAVADAVLEPSGGDLTREPFGDLRVYFRGSTDQLEVMEAGSLELKAGMTPHPPHKHPEEEIMIVTEGSGEISLNGKVTKCGPGSMMFCAAEHMHGIVNTGKTTLTFFYFKWKA